MVVVAEVSIFSGLGLTIEMVQSGIAQLVYLCDVHRMLI